MILRICQYGAAYFARRFFAFVRRAADGGCLTAAGGSPGVGARHIAEGAGGAAALFPRRAARRRSCGARGRAAALAQFSSVAYNSGVAL